MSEETVKLEGHYRWRGDSRPTYFKVCLFGHFIIFFHFLYF